MFLRAGHCVNSVRIQSFSGPSFPAFGLNTEIYRLNFHFQFECWKILTRKLPNMDTFYVVGRLIEWHSQSPGKVELCSWWKGATLLWISNLRLQSDFGLRTIHISTVPYLKIKHHVHFTQFYMETYPFRKKYLSRSLFLMSYGGQGTAQIAIPFSKPIILLIGHSESPSEGKP